MKKIVILISCFLLNSNLQLFAQKSQTKKTQDIKEIKVATKKFLNWYFDVYENFDDTIFNMRLITSHELPSGCDTNVPYRINFIGTNQYSKKLENTSIFSVKFIKAINDYFIRCDSNFVHHKQFCGEPMGFDEGVLARYMDDTGVKENRNSFKIIEYKQKGQTVFVKFKFGIGTYWTFEFTKFNSKWLIDKINGDFPKVIPYYPNHNYNECCN